MNTSFDIYRSPRSLSLLAVGFLAASIGCDALFLILGLGQILLPFDIPFESGEQMSAWLLSIGLIGVLQIIVFFATVVFFLMWLYRAYKNLPALKAAGTEFSPGWAIGWWFIPFANLIRPYQVVRELWQQSDPDFDPELNFLSNSVGSPPFLGWWWAFWLVSNFASNISMRLSDAETEESLFYFSIALIIASLLSIVAGILAIFVVKGITARQEKRFERLNALQSQFVPPPPPKFD